MASCSVCGPSWGTSIGSRAGPFTSSSCTIHQRHSSSGLSFATCCYSGSLGRSRHSSVTTHGILALPLGVVASTTDIRVTRSVPEWIGKTDDTPVPDRVKLRVFEKYEGKCYLSGIRLTPGTWEVEHIQAIINGGENRESNLAPVSKGKVHQAKSREDVKIRAITYRKKKANIGLRKKSRMPGSKDSPWRKKLNGQVVKR